MAVVYRVDYENHSGEVVAQFADFLSLRLELRWNDKSSLDVQLSGFDGRVALIGPDYLARVWMRDAAEGIDWMPLFTGPHKTEVATVTETGQRLWTSYCPSLEEILDKAYIMYPAGTSKTDKSGKVSTVMYAFVRENVGSLATVANGRDAAHVVAGLSLAPDLGVGPTWSGGRTRRHLLTVLQELAEYSREQGDPIDFRVVYQGDYTFQFEAGRLGVDRTTAGLNAATGLNAAGNVPVILSITNGNLARQTRSYARYNEANRVFVLGQGEGEEREVAIASDNASAALSPLALRETVTSDVMSGSLSALAEAKLQENVARPHFSFAPRRGSQILFRDYNLGDYVTGQDTDGTRYNKQIVGIRIAVDRPSGGGDIEHIDLEFAD